MAMALVITPSLAYMAEAVASAGVGSFGVGYGLYNMAWGVGLLGRPGARRIRLRARRIRDPDARSGPPLLLVVTLLLGEGTISAAHPGGVQP